MNASTEPFAPILVSSSSMRKPAPRLCITLIAILSTVPALVAANECEVPDKPLRVSGSLCGTVFDVTGAPLPDVQLRIVKGDRDVVAETSANSRARYQFPPVPKGRY